MELEDMKAYDGNNSEKGREGKGKMKESMT